MPRLVLDPTGIKRPLDLAPAPTVSVDAPATAFPAQPLTPLAPVATTPALYNAGRAIQTSLALDVGLADRLDALGRAGQVPLAALLIATLHAGLPSGGKDARRAVITERAAQVGGERTERNVRLPAQLRTRLDQLTEAARESNRRATRADLVNAILRQALPESAEVAAALVREHRTRVELSALDESERFDGAPHAAI